MQAIQGQWPNDQCENGAIYISRMGKSTGHGQDPSAHRGLQKVGKGLPVSGEYKKPE